MRHVLVYLEGGGIVFGPLTLFLKGKKRHAVKLVAFLRPVKYYFLKKEKGNTAPMKCIGFLPGSFDPVTYGHINLIARAFQLVDELVIGIGKNIHKTPLLPQALRQELLVQALPQTLQQEQRCRIFSFDGLAIQAAQDVGAQFIIKGLRNSQDYMYEATMAQVNFLLAPHIETLFLAAQTETSTISSSLVRELWLMKASLKTFVPPHVVQALEKLKGEMP